MEVGPSESSTDLVGGAGDVLAVYGRVRTRHRRLPVQYAHGREEVLFDHVRVAGAGRESVAIQLTLALVRLLICMLNGDVSQAER